MTLRMRTRRGGLRQCYFLAGLVASVAAACVVLGCGRIGSSDPDAPRLDPVRYGAPGAESPSLIGKPIFTDVTARAGIRFRHETGAFGQKYMPETMGSGCAFLDYDNDGWEDVLLINSDYWPGHKASGAAPTMKLYHNDHNGHFTDVTARMGLAIPMYGMGVAVGDYDNDGWDDLFVTALGGSHLFHNEHGHGFVDVTGSSGIHDAGWPTSAAWIDYDRDGRLDLFVCHYVKWTMATDIMVTADGIHKTYATPEPYAGESCRLYHNEGGGRFKDVTGPAGIASSHSKALSVVPLDFNGDGWTDIFVTNDTQPNFLFQNLGNGQFKQVALGAAVAVSEQGTARAGMGCDAADYDGSGRLSLVVSNFSGEQLALYHNDGGGLFTDRAAESGIGPASSRFLGFGMFFLDYDGDGRPDIFVNDGHVMTDISIKMTDVSYAERPLLFHNEGGGRFSDASAAAGANLDSARVGRGAARGDFDNDGAPDILLTTNQNRAYLFRNSFPAPRSWIGIRLVGRESNRDGYGAMVMVTTPLGEQLKQCTAAGSYLSSMDRRLLFGLGRAKSVSSVTIHWPSGRLQVVRPPAIDRYITIIEP